MPNLSSIPGWIMNNKSLVIAFGIGLAVGWVLCGNAAPPVAS